MSRDNEVIVQDFLDAVNDANATFMRKFLSDDFQFISPSTRVFNKETFCQIIPRIRDMIPDNRFNLVRMISQGGSIVMVTNRTGTFKKGVYFGVEAKNKPFNIPFINIFDLETGKIKRWEAYWNAKLLQQSQE
jgi:steroid delta-isomerase-like uncharacterized protein